MKKILLSIAVSLIFIAGGISQSTASEEMNEDLKLLIEKAEQGDAEAQFDVGKIYEKGQSVTQDYKEAVKWYTKAANNGLADAQYKLGRMYEIGGCTLEVDYRLAGQWYSKSARQGNAKAQFNLGKLYYHGRGVPQNYRNAMRSYELAARQGHAEAKFYIGEMFRFGHGFPQDYRKAIDWYTKSAEQGFAKAQYRLGEMYDNVLGVPHDDELSLRWYTMAAEQGYVYAQSMLGLKYELGDGVLKDYEKASKWHTKAAEQGHALSQIALGVMYTYGDGVSRDLIKAYKWYYLASSPETNQHAQSNLDELRDKMTAEQIAQAHELSREINKPSNQDCKLILKEWDSEIIRGFITHTKKISYKLHNKYDCDVKQVEATIGFYDLEGNILKIIKVQPNVLIESQKYKNFIGYRQRDAIGHFSEPERRFFTADKKNVKAEFNVRKIVFASDLVIEF